MARTRSLRTQWARHRVDHGTICGRSCAKSGHYKPLCACVDRTFINPTSRAGVQKIWSPRQSVDRAWFAPSLVGGGDAITQRSLAGAETLSLLPLVFLLRFGLGTVSYAAGTPGGLFAPMLALGAQLGLFFGLVCRLAFPDLDIQAEGFAVVGMAAFFTGVVRAPLTGIVLVTEMTANVTMLLPMLIACFAAMLVPTLLRNAPIYESLREHTLRGERVLQQQAQKR